MEEQIDREDSEKGGELSVSQSSSRDIEAIRKAVKAIEKKKGSCCTAVDLVAMAKPKSSPLHKFFTWDDHQAAQTHREDQARALIRRVYRIEYVKEKEVSVREFYCVTVGTQEEDRERGYVSYETAFGNTEYAEQIVKYALTELRRWVGRYRNYATLAKTADRIVQAIEQLELDLLW